MECHPPYAIYAVNVITLTSKRHTGVCGLLRVAFLGAVVGHSDTRSWLGTSCGIVIFSAPACRHSWQELAMAHYPRFSMSSLQPLFMLLKRVTKRSVCYWRVSFYLGLKGSQKGNRFFDACASPFWHTHTHPFGCSKKWPRRMAGFL